MDIKDPKKDKKKKVISDSSTDHPKLETRLQLFTPYLYINSNSQVQDWEIAANFTFKFL